MTIKSIIPALMIGVVLWVLLIWGMTVYAQEADDAPLYLVTIPTKTVFSGDPTGIAQTLMTKDDYDAAVERNEGSPDMQVEGFVWDAGWPVKQGLYVIPVAFFINGVGNYIERICDVKLYYADGFDDSDMPVYVFSGEFEYCQGPIPVFEEPTL